MKRFFAILLLTLMLASLTVNAFAADNGVITISNATKGKNYSLYKIFDATLNTSAGHEVYISYTYDGELPLNDFFTQDEGGTIRIVGEDAALSPEAVEFLGTLIAGKTPIPKTADSSTVVFDNLPYGYYYVVSSLGSAVSINSTKPTVTIYDKNQKPTWTDPEKGDVKLGKCIVLNNGTEVTENSASFGDTVHFKVSFNATDYVGEDKVLTYYLTDKICEGFEIDQDSLRVYFDKDTRPKTIDTDYKVTWRDNRTFVITAPWAGDNETSLYGPTYGANVVIKVTYDAVLKTNAVIAGEGNPNIAYFEYRTGKDTAPDPSDKFAPPKPEDPLHKSTEEKTVTYTYAVGLTKIDGETLQKIDGAEFSLCVKGKETAPLTFAAAPGKEGVYEYDKNGEITQVTTKDGVLVIRGLAYGTYVLKETKSPDGYNRAIAGTEFTLKKSEIPNYKKVQTYEKAGKSVTTDYEEFVYAIPFENEHGVALPITGGMGTTIFYILGGGLMFVAILLLITRKRMNNEK